MADIVSAREPFSADVQGVPVSVGVGDLYYADDPVVKGRESLFGAVTVRRTLVPQREGSPAGDETADAAPGTRRKATSSRVSTTTPGKGADEPPAPKGTGSVSTPSKDSKAGTS